MLAHYRRSCQPGAAVGLWIDKIGCTAQEESRTGALSFMRAWDGRLWFKTWFKTYDTIGRKFHGHQMGAAYGTRASSISGAGRLRPPRFFNPTSRYTGSQI